MRRAILFAAVVLPLSSADAQLRLVGKDGKPCAPGATMVGAAAGKPGVRKLGEMPPASQILTVYRTVDRCPVPVVLRRDVGNSRR